MGQALPHDDQAAPQRPFSRLNTRPTAWRKRRLTTSNVSSRVLTLTPLPPFRLDLTVWALRRRAENPIDRWDGTTYRRVLVLQHQPVEVAVTQMDSSDQPRLQGELTGPRLSTSVEMSAAACLEWMLGLRLDLSAFYRLAAGDPQLGPLVERFRGLKPPRFPSVFETLVNAIACQQVTLTFGIRLLGRLAEQYGVAVQTAGGVAHAFPQPSDLAAADPKHLRSLAFSSQKARALVEAARAIGEGQPNPDELASQDDETVTDRLCQLHGIGRWSAEYVLLRGLGRLGVFPGDDVGARNNLRRWLGLPEPLDYAGVQRVVARWQPYAGLVYLHLLLDRLAAAGHLSDGAGADNRA